MVENNTIFNKSQTSKQNKQDIPAAAPPAAPSYLFYISIKQQLLSQVLAPNKSFGHVSEPLEKCWLVSTNIKQYARKSIKTFHHIINEDNRIIF